MFTSSNGGTLYSGATKLTSGTGAAGAGQQGYSVAISGDGKTVIVGAPFDTAGGANAGAVWIYVDSGGGIFTQQGSIHSGAAGDQLGTSVELSADGNTAVAGALGGNSATVFTRSGSTWSVQATLTVAGSASLGKSVGMSQDGNTVLLGGPASGSNAGGAWVFTRSGGTWSAGAQLPLGTPAIAAGRQGMSVSLSANGLRALVGGYSTSLSGAAWVYSLVNGSWIQEAQLAYFGAGGSESQGAAVALSGDGTIAMEGAPSYNGGFGAAVVFQRSVNPTTQAVSWAFQGGAQGNAANWNCGVSLAIVANANAAAYSCPGSGNGEVATMGTPDLAITKTHNGTFTRGAAGSYKISVSNVGTNPSSGTATVTDKMPTGLTYTGFSGSGWSCSSSTVSAVTTVTCSSTNAVAAGASYPDLTLNVNVSASAPVAIGNTATVSGGGDSNTNNNTSTDLVQLPQLIDLSIAKTHTGALASGAVVTYKIVVQNVGNKASSGAVTVADTLPGGLSSPVLVTSSGWTSCSFSGNTLSCSRSDSLAGGGAYPPITYTATVSGGGTISNTATVSGGGDANATNNSSTDSATVGTSGPDLTIAKSHAGNFVHGQTDAWTLTVSNVGSAPSAGQVMVVDNLPAGVTLVSMSGTGWTCATFLATCVRSNALAPGAAYPTIRVTVKVANAGPVTNTATVSGGGDINLGNNTASDPTTVN